MASMVLYRIKFYLILIYASNITHQTALHLFSVLQRRAGHLQEGPATLDLLAEDLRVASREGCPLEVCLRAGCRREECRRGEGWEVSPSPALGAAVLSP